MKATQDDVKIRERSTQDAKNRIEANQTVTICEDVTLVDDSYDVVHIKLNVNPRRDQIYIM